MADFPILAVELRDGRGKGAARAVRREGFVPGVIYGGKREPTSIKVDRRVLESELHSGGFFSKLYDLEADPREVNNVYGQPEFAEVQAVMLAELDRLQAKAGDAPRH